MNSPIQGPTGTEVVPDWSVVITPRQQYEELRSLTAAVNTLKSSLDPALIDLRKDTDDHELRLRLLENKHTVSPAQLWTAVASCIGVIGVVLGVVFNIIRL